MGKYAEAAVTLTGTAGPCCVAPAGEWAIQDSNTPRNVAGKRASRKVGAAKSAASDADSTPPCSSPTGPAGGSRGELAELLRTVARLPLADGERAELVRRLLAGE